MRILIIEEHKIFIQSLICNVNNNTKILIENLKLYRKDSLFTINLAIWFKSFKTMCH